FFQGIQILQLSFSVYDPLQDLQHTFGTFTAGNTFSAGLPLGKAHEETGNFYHTGIFIHNNQAAGAHDGIVFLHIVKIQPYIQMFFCKTSAGRTADLDSLKVAAPFDAAADIVDDLPECSTHGNLNKAGVFNSTCNRESLGSRAAFCSDGTEPVSSFYDNTGNICKSFHVI